MDSQEQMMNIGGKMNTIGRAMTKMHGFLVFCSSSNFAAFHFQKNQHLKLEGGGEGRRSRQWSPRQRLRGATNAPTGQNQSMQRADRAHTASKDQFVIISHLCNHYVFIRLCFSGRMPVPRCCRRRQAPLLAVLPSQSGPHKVWQRPPSAHPSNRYHVICLEENSLDRT